MKLKDKEKELNDMNNNLINNDNIKKYVDFNKIIVINFMSGDGIINNIGIKCLKTDTFEKLKRNYIKNLMNIENQIMYFFMVEM